jgi:hypothetical protein
LSLRRLRACLVLAITLTSILLVRTLKLILLEVNKAQKELVIILDLENMKHNIHK